MKTQPKGPFLGINNRLPDSALHLRDKGDYLRDAENVDIDNAGRLRRRPAVARLQALTAPHSLYTAASGTHYLVRDSVLYAVTLPTYAETLVKILASNAPVSYAEHNGSLYYANGTDSGRIESGAWYPWGLATPSAPSVASLPSGELFAGYYQVAVSYARFDGGTLLEEGGVSASSNYELGDTGGLRVALPPATPGATHVLVYVSTVNGSIPMLTHTVAVGTATVDVTLQSELMAGREVVQRYEETLPAGRPFIHNSRLCSVVGKDIFIGSVARMGYYVPTDPLLSFPEDVAIAISAQNGIYVAADKTYWIAGTDVLDVQMVQDVLPYGAVPGTEFASPNKSLVGWFGEQGIVLGTPSGEAEAVMSDNIELTPPASGISSVFTDRGYRRVVSCGWCLNLDNLAATRYADYDFTSVSGQYGTKSDGIYDLSVSGDVPYVVDFGKANFGAEHKKAMPAAYIGAASDGPLQLRIKTPEHDYTYAARSFSVDLDMHRIDPGKGLRSNWFDLSLVGESDFTLASVSFAPVASKRRI